MPDAEIEAMGRVADALGELDDEARGRILRWASERYGVGLAPSRTRGAKVEELDEDELGDDESDRTGSGSSGTGSDAARQFEHFAELFDAVDPSTDAERVLVAAYWTQVHVGKSTFGSQELNGLLKNLGHGVGTINRAVQSNISKKPSLILQVSRGSSQQARKKLKVTEAGLKWIKERLGT